MVVDACGIVPDDELSDMSFLRNRCSLSGCGVHGALAAVGVLLNIRCFVVERLHTVDDWEDSLRVTCVGAVRIALDRLTVAMALGEQEAAGRHLVLQRDSGDSNGAVFKDDLALARANRVEDDLIRHRIAMIVQQRFDQSLKVSRRIDMQGLRASHHAEGGDESYQTEAMVAVQVRNEDVVQTGCTQRHPAEPDLATLAAVNHERLVAELQHLASRGVLERGQSTAAT